MILSIDIDKAGTLGVEVLILANTSLLQGCYLYIIEILT